MQAVARRRQTFQMPGHRIEGFTRKSVQIANAGIYDLRQHRDQVLVPVLRQWTVWDIEGLDAEAEKARTELDEFLDGARRRRDRASRSAATPAPPGSPSAAPDGPGRQAAPQPAARCVARSPPAPG